MLLQVAKQVGKFINDKNIVENHGQLPSLSKILSDYADHITPWAERVAMKMLEEANQRDIAAWRATSTEISKEINREIIKSPVGEIFYKLQKQQIELIRSIPLEASQRLHRIISEEMLDSTRASELQSEIMRSGEVAASRARAIARTEVSRAASNFTQARAQNVGSLGYIWRTSRDATVRHSHRKMEGKFVNWNDPPTLDGMTGNAGTLVNCRCWAEVVLGDE